MRRRADSQKRQEMLTAVVRQFHRIAGVEAKAWEQLLMYLQEATARQEMQTRLQVSGRTTGGSLRTRGSRIGRQTYTLLVEKLWWQLVGDCAESDTVVSLPRPFWACVSSHRTAWSYGSWSSKRSRSVWPSRIRSRAIGSCTRTRSAPR